MLEPLSFIAGIVSLPLLYIILAAIILTVEIAYESSWLAIITLGAASVGYWWLGWVDPHWFIEHWKTVLLYVALYSPIGVLWATTKWWFYLRFRVREAHDRIEALHNRFGDDDAGKAQRAAEWERESDWPPMVRNHKSDIMRWLCWWPFSFIGTMLNDPLRRFFEAIYREIATYLQRMSDNMWARLPIPKLPEKVDAPSS
jgi:hypothetical protein